MCGRVGVILHWRYHGFANSSTNSNSSLKRVLLSFRSSRTCECVCCSTTQHTTHTTYTHKQREMYISTLTNTHTHKHTHTYRYMYARAHTHTQTHTHIPSHPLLSRFMRFIRVHVHYWIIYYYVCVWWCPPSLSWGLVFNSPEVRELDTSEDIKGEHKHTHTLFKSCFHTHTHNDQLALYLHSFTCRLYIYHSTKTSMSRTYTYLKFFIVPA